MDHANVVRRIERAARDVMVRAMRGLDARDDKVTSPAGRDELTGLPNKSAFDVLLAREIERAAASGRPSALLFVDLDQFKYVNGSLNHAAGDRVLKLAAERLRLGVRSDDVVARFGGDEFVVLLRDVSRERAASMCAELVDRMQREAFCDGLVALNVRCSIGATMIRGTKSAPARVLSRADTACHQAKSNGRNQFCFYNGASKDCLERTADAAWSQQIQRALREDAFVLHYQPIVNVRSRETVYYEVLLRMLVDGDELVFPMSFLPAAARVGLTVDIDHWVMRHSLRSLAALRAARGDIRFTLNVSGSTFDRADFFDTLETELKATGVPLEAIVIEITEQTAMRDPAAAAARMAGLVDRGCRFAMDDFGSGYCSFTYLKELPIAFVKIDGSFLANVRGDAVDRKIVAAIADVAAAAGCETIAEHVQDRATFELLEGLGVTYAQGYMLGEPCAELRPAVTDMPPALNRRRAAPRRGERQRSLAPITT